jgi:peptidoglycan/LPS O-acetylase OafA/YrhL
VRNRLVPLLMVLTGALAAAEFVDSVIIWREDYPDAQPLFAVAFGVLYLVALALQRRGRTVAGAVLAGALFLFEVVTAPTWQRFSALDWTTQLLFGGLSLAGLLVAVAVLVRRRSDSVPAGR